MGNNEARTLKEALYNTLHKSRLHIDSIADQLGMTQSYLYRAALPDPDTDGPNASGVRFPLKQLSPLIRITGDYQVLDYIEQSLGRVGVELPRPERNSMKDLQLTAINAAAEFGDLMREVAGSMADQKLTETEIKQIKLEGHQAIQAIMQVMMACDHVRNG